MVTRRILIADDDAVAARQFEHRLTALGYEIAAVASSPDEALTAAVDAEPDLLLIAPALGGGGRGIALADELHQRRRLPTLLVIAPADESHLAEARVFDRFAYVVTPFTDRELRATIDLALCKRDAVQAVRDLEDRFFSVSVDMLCFLDFDGYFKRLNPAWERTLGFTREELMSKPFFEFVHPDDRERTLNQNREVRSGGRALSFENRYRCKDGSYRWLRWNAAPDSYEQVIYSVARDVTDSKLAEEERERLVTELQAALAEVTTLRAILPICSYCKSIRDDENYWHTVESYISRHTLSRFSHGICPKCMATQIEPQFRDADGG
jgi:PAS domain S-box-containing protein